MHKPWLRADDAWSGEREPGGYLHGPWPKFWVEPERRDEFVQLERRASDGLGLASLHGGGPARRTALGPARYHELRYEDLVREPLDERRAHPRLPGHPRASESRDVVPRGVPACGRASPGHVAQHVLPVRARRDRGRGRATCCASWATRTEPSGLALDRVGFLHLGRPGERRPTIRPAHRRRGRDPRRVDRPPGGRRPHGRAGPADRPGRTASSTRRRSS